ncbi:MAG: helix-turn-helix transcriptional regulator [Clostridia bacterium]|nr:helix-turn-helix transcriptional regulator [Clostridia bacterium]
MMLTIGQNIKRLRRNVDMTQEELAELLSISSQAVSRWETGSALPDISLIPAIVNLFGVTSDELLGIDVSQLQKQVAEYKQKMDDLYKHCQYSEMLELARRANREIPNNMELKGMLAFALNSNSNKAENVDESIELYQEILEKSVDQKLRFRAITALCSLYAEKKDNKEQALFYANLLPKWNSQTAADLIRRYRLLPDSEMERFYQIYIQTATNALSQGLFALSDPNYYNSASTISVPQKIELLKQILQILKIIYGEPLLSQNREFYEINRVIGCLYLLENKTDQAMDYFEVAFAHAKEYEKYHDGDCYSSLSMKGFECDEHYLYDTTAVQDMLDRFSRQSRYDCLREHPRFQKLMEELQNSVQGN